ncbi:MAG: indolepyruvate oxidoreductase subunit beta [Thermoprotei archaeon]|nr:MAG: indolepyruvate oxidoreductase subunit beta [Thermoprotei archaeon]
MVKEYNVIIAGVGGQGGLTLSRVIAEAAFISGYEVRTGETLGMSQRYGSVVSYVRFGTEVKSPLPTYGSANALIGLEPLEAVRVLRYLNKEVTIGVVNAEPIPPVLSALSVVKKWGSYTYPDVNELINIIRSNVKELYVVKGYEILKRFKASRSLNILLLGVYAAHPSNPLSSKAYEEAIKRVLRRDVELNLKVFNEGLRIGKEILKL